MKELDASIGAVGDDVKAEGFSPVKAIGYGLLVSVVLASTVSMVESVVFAVLTAPSLGDERKFVGFFSNSMLFLMINVFLYCLIMYYAGKVVKQHAPSKEVKFGILVSVLTFLDVCVFVLGFKYIY